MQRLAVASVLVLGLLAVASAFMIQSHVFGQAQPQVSATSQNSQASSATTIANSNSTSPTITHTSSGLLTTTTTHTSHDDD